MNVQSIMVQFKREFWENKTGFFVIPLIITALLLVVMIFGSLYMGNKMAELNHKFQAEHAQVDANGDKKEAAEVLKPFNLFESVERDKQVFGQILVGAVQINSVFLMATFIIVLLGYSHRCLFDDRRNRDILFWRSLPVSETKNVLVKLVTTIFIAPVVMFFLNVGVWLICFLVGLILLAGHGVGLGYLFASVASNPEAWIVFHVFLVSSLGILALIPVIGFVLWASAFAKKSPFFTSTLVPILLIVADKAANSLLGINLHVVDILNAYSQFWLSINSVFNPVTGTGMTAGFALGFLMSASVGGAFIAVAIWLRNHRYEI